MPSSETVNRLRKTQQTIAEWAQRDLARLWDRLDHTDVEATRKALAEFFPVLINKYGDLSATAAAEWYEDVIFQRALMSGAREVEVINKRMRWAVRPDSAGASNQALANLQLVTDELVKQFGRDVITLSARKHKIRWARVPTGAETCAFCLMLAGRGYVYRSAKKGGDSFSGNEFHGHCDCAVVPDDGVIPENYDPDFFFDRYNSARNTRPEELLNRDEMSEEEYNRRLKLMSGFSDRAITARIRAKFDLK